MSYSVVIGRICNRLWSKWRIHEKTQKEKVESKKAQLATVWTPASRSKNPQLGLDIKVKAQQAK
jgi:hypothetical protein